MLVVAPQPFFSPRGTPLSVYYRTLVSAELGAEVDLLTYWEGSDPDIPGVRVKRIPKVPFTSSVPVGPSIKKLVLDVFMVFWTLGLLLRNRYDAVHAHEEAVFWCRFLKPFFRFKMIYDMHSSLPQQLLNFSFTKSRVLIGLFERLENSALRAAEGVIAISPALAEYARELIPDPSKLWLIENSMFDPVQLRKGAGRNGEEEMAVPEFPRDRQVVLYAGTFESYQGLDLLVEAVSEVRKTHPEAFLVMVGGVNSQIEEYQGLAARIGLNGHSVISGRIPHGVANDWVRAATVVTSIRTTGSNTPLKVYQLLASGRPLVATRIPSHTQVLDESVCILADPTVEGLAEGIRTALDESDSVRSRCAAAQERYSEKYSPDAYRQKLEGLFSSLDLSQ